MAIVDNLFAVLCILSFKSSKTIVMLLSLLYVHCIVLVPGVLHCKCSVLHIV